MSVVDNCCCHVRHGRWHDRENPIFQNRGEKFVYGFKHACMVCYLQPVWATGSFCVSLPFVLHLFIHLCIFVMMYCCNFSDITWHRLRRMPQTLLPCLPKIHLKACALMFLTHIIWSDCGCSVLYGPSAKLSLDHPEGFIWSTYALWLCSRNKETDRHRDGFAFTCVWLLYLT